MINFHPTHTEAGMVREANCVLTDGAFRVHLVDGLLVVRKLDDEGSEVARTSVKTWRSAYRIIARG